METVGAVIMILLQTGQPTAQRCDLSDITRSRETHEALTRRAVEIVERASAGDWENDPRLAQLVPASAIFTSGAGDVRVPLAQGPSGARMLAVRMKASAFRFYGWDYMNTQADACALRKVTVEFIDPDTSTSSPVEFTFENGFLVSAMGWQRSFEAGTVSSIAEGP